MSHSLELYQLGNLAEQITTSDGSNSQNCLVIPPYENDPYAGLFKPNRTLPELPFVTSFDKSLAAVRTFLGFSSFSFSGASAFNEFHDEFKPTIQRWNKDNLPTLLLKTDYTIRVGNHLRDPSYRPRLPLVHHLSSILSAPVSVGDLRHRPKKSEPRKMIDVYRQKIARDKLLMSPVRTESYYQEFSEDERGRPTDLVAENAFAWNATVFTWDRVSTPQDGKTRSAAYNVIPHPVWIFHSVRFAVQTVQNES